MQCNCWYVGTLICYFIICFLFFPSVLCVFLGFILFRIHTASWICSFIFFQMCQVFSHDFFEYFFSSALSHWDSDDMNFRPFVIVLQTPEALLILLQLIFSVSFRLDKVIVLYSSSLIILSVPSILLLSPSTELLFHILYFSILKFPFGTYLSLLLFCWDFSSFYWFMIVHRSIFNGGCLKLFVR